MFFFIFFSSQIFAQSDSQFSQYMFNGLVVNPAMAGSKESISVNVLAKKQWIGFGGQAPVVEAFNIHSPFKYQRIGLGLQLSRESFGIQSRTSVSGSYAYKINLAKGVMSFGLSLGLVQSSIRYSSLLILEEEKPFHQDVNIIYPDLGFGLFYQSSRFYVGVSSLHLLESNLSYSSSTFKVDALKRHYYLMMGYKFKISDKLELLPSTLVKYISGSQYQADFTTHLKYDDFAWIGASLRTYQTYSVQCGIKISDLISINRQSIKFGYAYDWSDNALSLVSHGSHELMLILDLNNYQKPLKIRKGKINISPVLF